MKLDTVEISEGTPIHFSQMDGAAHFVCGVERFKGDWWTHWKEDVKCPKCKAWITERDGER